MRFLHTADWHAGKTLHGIDRTPEIRLALEEVLEAAKTYDVDLITVAGDLFDSRNPSAVAEDAVNAFFQEATAAELKVVAISGNHDSPSRLDALNRLTTMHGSTVVGWPRDEKSGCLSLKLPKDFVQIACIPFISQRLLLTTDQVFEGTEGELHTTYQGRMRDFIRMMTKNFSQDSVNILLMHGTFEGATLSHSEYTFHVGSDYAMNPEHLPKQVTYAALGHIHKPQPVRGYSGDEARYCGSLIALDFGESNDKYVYVVEARAGEPARTVDEVKLTSGKPLSTKELTLQELEAQETELKRISKVGYLKLIVKLDQPMTQARERIRARINPTILQVIQPDEGSEKRKANPSDLSLEANFNRYWTETKGDKPAEGLLKELRRLHEDVVTEANASS